LSLSYFTRAILIPRKIKGAKMAKRQVTFTFPQELIREPIIYTLSHQFKVVTNIRRADISENRGWVVLELEGEEKDLEQGIAWVTSKGVRVDPVIGDIVEG
jgi:ABC-type methionine transport system ATPase subunit